MKYQVTLYILFFAMVFIINTAASEIKDDDTAEKKNGKKQDMDLKSQNKHTAAPESKDDGTAVKNNGKKSEMKSKNKIEINENNLLEKNNEKKKEKKRKVKNGKRKNPNGIKMDLKSLKTIAQLFVSGFQNNFDDVSVNTKNNKIPSLTLGPVGKMVATELIKEIWNFTAEVDAEDKGENSKKSSNGGKTKSGLYGSSGSIGKIFISEIHKDFGNITVADSTKDKKRPIWSLGPIGREVAKGIIEEVKNMTDEMVQEVRVENKMNSFLGNSEMLEIFKKSERTEVHYASTMQTTPAPMEMSTMQTTPEDMEMSTEETTPEAMEMSTMQTSSEDMEMSTMETTPDAVEMSTTSTETTTLTEIATM